MAVVYSRFDPQFVFLLASNPVQHKPPQPHWPSQPWHHEGVGTAKWTGTPLAPLLREAGLLDDTVEVAFFGADRGFDRGEQHEYGRSLPVATALDGEAILAWEMNGQVTLLRCFYFFPHLKSQ
jgi:DMSO/TMAO reductase YedYZ molybdopterin-dependent catalytic subunit